MQHRGSKIERVAGFERHRFAAFDGEHEFAGEAVADLFVRVTVFAADRAFGGATYPLGLRVEPGEELLLRIIYDQRRFSSSSPSIW